MSINFAFGQDFISIVGKSPYTKGTKVLFEGYDGFQKLELGSIRTTDNGSIDFFVDYHGQLMMSAEGNKNSWPLILKHDPTCIEFDSIISFPCDPENEFYYTMLTTHSLLDSLIINYWEISDSSEKVKAGEDIFLKINDFRAKLKPQQNLYAGVLLEGDLLIFEAGMQRNTEGLAEVKEKTLSYIQSNYERIRYSDILPKLVVANSAMNKRVFPNPSSLTQVQVFDVGEWANILEPHMDLKAVINFYLIHFIKNGDADVSATLLGKYGQEVICEQYVSSNTRPANMPYSFSVFGGPDLKRVFPLDQFMGLSKILAIYSTECPSSVASVAGLYSIMSENQIRMPVIMVPNDEQTGELAELVKKEAPFGMQTGMKTGSGIIIGAGVKQLPAFIILDERNLLKQIFYDLKSLKLELMGD